MLVQKLAVFFAGEVLKLFGDPLDPLGHDAGRLVSDLTGDFFLRITGGTKLEDFQIGLARRFLKSSIFILSRTTVSKAAPGSGMS